MSRQDRPRATISDSVDPQHPWFCLYSVAFHFSKVRHEIAQSSVCSNVFTLWATLGPVLSRYLLLDFFEEVGEVVQAADRRAASVLADRGVLAQGAQQNGTLDVE